MWIAKETPNIINVIEKQFFIHKIKHIFDNKLKFA
jgi:hypothetical protein